MQYTYTYALDKTAKNTLTIVIDTEVASTEEENKKNIMKLVAKVIGAKGNEDNVKLLKTKKVNAAIVVNGKPDAKALGQEMDYAKTVAEAHVYVNCDGVVGNKAGYTSLLEELRWLNKAMLPQMDQYAYVRRPSPGGKTLVRNSTGVIEDLHRIDANGQQTWIAPDGHVVTEAEYLAGIAGRVAPRHHSDMNGTMSMYQVDEKYMKMVVNTHGLDRKVADVPETHYVYEEMRPAGTQLHLAYIGVPVVDGEATSKDYNRLDVMANVPVTRAMQIKGQKQIRRHLCTRVIPRMGRSVMRETPSRNGYLTKNMEVTPSVHRHMKITCPEVRQDGSICGGYYKPDSQGNKVCQNCGIIYEQTEEEIVEELRLIVNSAGSTSRVEDDNDETDEIEITSLEEETEYEDEEAELVATETDETVPGVRKYDMYTDKWIKAQKNYSMRRILALIAAGVTDTAEQYPMIGCSKDTYYRYVKELIEKGRITATKTGRRNNLAVVPVARPVRTPNQAKYDGRAKYGKLEYTRGSVQMIGGLHPGADRMARTYSAIERPIGEKAKVDKDYAMYRVRAPSVMCMRRWLDADTLAVNKDACEAAKETAYETRMIRRGK